MQYCTCSYYTNLSTVWYEVFFEYVFSFSIFYVLIYLTGHCAAHKLLKALTFEPEKVKNIDCKGKCIILCGDECK